MLPDAVPTADLNVMCTKSKTRNIFTCHEFNNALNIQDCKVNLGDHHATKNIETRDRSFFTPDLIRPTKGS